MIKWDGLPETKNVFVNTVSIVFIINIFQNKLKNFLKNFRDKSLKRVFSVMFVLITQSLPDFIFMTENLPITVM